MHSCANAVALVLRIWKVPRSLSHCGGGIIPKKQTACYRIPGIPHYVGVAGEARERPPTRSFDLSLRTVENGIPKCDRKAYPGAEELRVVGVVIHVAAEHIRVHPHFIEEYFRQSRFIIIPVRRLDGQLHCGNAGVDSLRLWRAGQKYVFEGGCLEDAVKRSVNIEAKRGKVARDGESRAHRVLVHQQLVVV